MRYFAMSFATVICWECGKWLYRLIFFKTVEMILPSGKVSVTVYRFQKSVDPENVLKHSMATSGCDSEFVPTKCNWHSTGGDPKHPCAHHPAVVG